MHPSTVVNSVRAEKKLSPYEREAKNLELDSHHLQDAFEQFERLSKHFLQSYSEMESKVTQLSRKLASETNLHEKTVVENQKLSVRLEHLLNIMPVGVIILDDQGIIQECNRAGEAFFSGDIIGRRWTEVVKQYFIYKEDDFHEVSMVDGKRVKIETCSLKPELGQLVILNDMTETRRLQERQSRNQRLSTIGRMMASLSHQIRTPLSAAMLYASHLSDFNLDENQKVQCQEKLLSRLHNIDRQIKDMLIFARGDTLVKENISVVNFTRKWLGIVTPELNAGEYTFVYNDDDLKDGVVNINTDNLIGALMNLLENSIQAMQSEKINKKLLTVDVKTTTSQLIITINDTGVGIDPHHLDDIFEPFYTTKKNGTGLGLAIVNSVVRQHQGEITLRSKPGIGTQFVIEIPLVKQGINPVAEPLCSLEK